MNIKNISTPPMLSPSTGAVDTALHQDFTKAVRYDSCGRWRERDKGATVWTLQKNW